MFRLFFPGPGTGWNSRITRWLLVWLLLPAGSARADLVNLTQADKCETILEVFIEGGSVTVRMEIGEGDFAWFSGIIPETFYKDGYNDLTKAGKWRRFMEKQLILLADGRRLKGRVRVVDYRNKTRRTDLYYTPDDSITLKSKIIFVEIEYMTKGRISELILRPPLMAGQSTTGAKIGMIVYHEKIPVNDLKFLAKEEKLELDWNDPWYSRFQNPDIRRHHDASFMSFLYMEPFEVRHEILVRLKDLAGWIDLPYSNKDYIPISHQEKLKQQIASLLMEHNPIFIDGVARRPVPGKVHFVEAGLSGVRIIETPEPLLFPAAIIGVIFTYPVKGMPQKIKLKWDMFNEKIRRIPCVTIDPSGPWPYELRPQDNVLVWKNFLKHYRLPTVVGQQVETVSMFVPVVSVILWLGAVFLFFVKGKKFNRFVMWQKILLAFLVITGFFTIDLGREVQLPFIKQTPWTEPDARSLMTQLLKNTYRAFDFREESDVYDKLSLCNADELLEKIYLNTRKKMVIENQGGLQARVEEIVVTNVEKVDDDDGEGIAYRCRWTVKGEVGHWGHKHKRINSYDAIIRIKPVEGLWKMYDIDMIEEKRL